MQIGGHNESWIRPLGHRGPPPRTVPVPMFLLALLLLVLPTTLLAQQQQQPPGEPAAGGKRMIYVATTGSDASPGTQAQPLATMASAAKAIVATLSGGLPAGGIEVRVAAGVYEVNASTSLRLGHHFFGVSISGTAARRRRSCSAASARPTE